MLWLGVGNLVVAPTRKPSNKFFKHGTMFLRASGIVAASKIRTGIWHKEAQEEPWLWVDVDLDRQFSGSEFVASESTLTKLQAIEGLLVTFIISIQLP